MEWISIENQFPSTDEWIIGCKGKRVEYGIWLEDEKDFIMPDLGYATLEITHWMPLPSPPDKDGKCS